MTDHDQAPPPVPEGGIVTRDHVLYGTFDIDVVNSTKTFSDQQVATVMNAVAKQVQQGSVFANRWGASGRLHLVPKGGTPNKNWWWMALLDHTEEAGALGFHDLTSAGLPLGKVGVLDGGAWSCTFSHEVLEMLADPLITMCYQVSDSRLVAGEVADAPEADEYGYLVDGQLVSDFVFPLYFVPGVEAKHFDRTGHIKEPLQILPGGYLSVLDFNGAVGWRQIYGPGNGLSAGTRTARYDVPGAPQGSRRERRRVGQGDWVKSAATI